MKRVDQQSVEPEYWKDEDFCQWKDEDFQEWKDEDFDFDFELIKRESE